MPGHISSRDAAHAWDTEGVEEGSSTAATIASTLTDYNPARRVM
jgi:hypothetical protein